MRKKNPSTLLISLSIVDQYILTKTQTLPDYFQIIQRHNKFQINFPNHYEKKSGKPMETDSDKDYIPRFTGRGLIGIRIYVTLI